MSGPIKTDSAACLPPAPAQQPEQPAGFVLVERQLLERASASLGSFVGDCGWAQSDMDTLDSVDAALALAARPQAEQGGEG